MVDPKPSIAREDGRERPNAGKIPIAFKLGDRMIDGAIVKPVSFAAWTEYIGEAQGMKHPKAFESRLKRIRMVKQVAYYTNGSIAAVTMEDILNMPIPAARTINTKLEEDDDNKAGSIIREGDGVDTAITYELGTPIPIQGKPPIKELEFVAKTYGDIEDVLAAPNGFAQTKLLIETIAKPLGTSLMRLPTDAVKQISMSDGMTILNKVLPHFLGSDAE